MNRRSEDGMTLVELVVVIALLGILSVAAAPLFEGASSTALWNASRRIAIDLRYAQEYAQQYGLSTVVEFDLRSQRYRVLQGSSRRPVADPLHRGDLVVDFEDLSGVTLVSVDPPSESESRSGSPSRSSSGAFAADTGGSVRRIAYSSSGETADGASIVLAHESGESIRMEVEPTSGRVRIDEG